jgi:hypothetical protein
MDRLDQKIEEINFAFLIKTSKYVRALQREV